MGIFNFVHFCYLRLFFMYSSVYLSRYKVTKTNVFSVCIYVRTFVCMFVFMFFFVCMYVFSYVCLYWFVCLFVCIGLCVRWCACACIFKSLCIIFLIIL